MNFGIYAKVERFKQMNKLKPYINRSYLLIFSAVLVTVAVFALVSRVLAADEISFDWDFSAPGDYTLSNSDAVEVSGNKVQLKPLSYGSDDDTIALWHLDEGVGTNFADSSTNSNDATVSNGSWDTSLLNNSYIFSANNTGAIVPDSASLSFAGANTTEARIKFASSFMSGSHSQRQTILDKGSYQLYFDNETGKLVYELGNAEPTTWTQRAGNSIDGSWDLDGHTQISDSVNIGSDIYFALGTVIDDAEVWKWDGSNWEMVGGDGVNDSWPLGTYEVVWSLATDGTHLYVGLGLTAGDGDVYKYTPATKTWEKIGGDNLNSSWTVNTFETITALHYFNGNLYAGLGISGNDGEVWRWNPVENAWTKIGGDSLYSGWTASYDVVYALADDGTHLYAGLGLTAGEAEVWMWTPDGELGSWTKVGGDGINSSWADTTYEAVWTLLYVDGKLFAGLGNTAGDAEVWEGTKSGEIWSWSKIGGDGDLGSWADATYEAVYSLETDGTNIYAGLGLTGGDNEVYRRALSGGNWTKIGGDGENGGFGAALHTIVRTMLYHDSVLYTAIDTANANTSPQVWTWENDTWTLIGGNYVNHSWGFRGLRSVETLTTHGGYLYAGTGQANAGSTIIMRYNGQQWELVGGQGINGSWEANTYETVLSAASYKGDYYVGLGITAGDAEVWKFNGSTWTKVGGDGINESWPDSTYEEVVALAADDTYLYAGLGLTAADGEVWRYSKTTGEWDKIGGDNLYSGWAAGFERVMSLLVYKGKLVAGLGSTSGDAEVWQWTPSGETGSWLRLGGDGINDGWNAGYDTVEEMVEYDGKLYAGLGVTAGEAEVWEWNGSAWTLVGGDGERNSWPDSTYERVQSMAVYNGHLYAGLGVTAGDGEVWRYNGSTWAKVGGDGAGSGWVDIVESVLALTVYQGQLFAATGITANADAAVWSLGDNSILSSTTSSFNTAWHHVAGTYDGETMRLFIDGEEEAFMPATATVSDTTNRLFIGTGLGSTGTNQGAGYFEGNIDEIRISSVAREEFVTSSFSSQPETVSNASAAFTQGIGSYAGFVVDEDTNGGTITYRLSHDNGVTWKYWDGDSWEFSDLISQANSANDINSNIESFPVSEGGIKWQAILYGSGNEQVTLNSVTVEANEDLVNPTPPDSISALNQSGGDVSLNTGTWYNYPTPYFSWSGATDPEGAGVAGYFVYFGTDETANPSTAGNFQTDNSFNAVGLTNGQTYYLRIQTKDGAQNVSSIWDAFTYKFDNINPSNPVTVSVSPSGYSSTNYFTFSWPSSGGGSASDAHSGVAGYQYKTGTDSGEWSDWSSTTTDTIIVLDGGAYKTEVNTFYLRTVDHAGNISATPKEVLYYFSGGGPSEPKFLSATPNSNTTNSFAFSWQPPDAHAGDVSELTYCYTVNALPSQSNCVFTSPGATSLAAGSFANQVGLNTFYLVARDPAGFGGTVNYGSYASATFTANTSAPGIPLGIEISDVSIKNSAAWRLALSWAPPENEGSGVENYQIYRSDDDSTYSLVATTSGAAYIDTGLEQQTYYYKVKACDNVLNCGAFTTAVSRLPTGKFTEPAVLEGTPTISSITTKTATVTWATNRASDSKVQYGKSSDEYYDEEPSNSTQTVAHTINLTSLSPGTTYYARAKWTDEDGNTGVSGELTFKTKPAPSVKDPQPRNVGVNSATIEYTVSGASRAKIYYGETTGFGGVLELSTSTSETTYSSVLEDLKDGTKYFYKINLFDAEGSEYDGSILSFDTLPRPRISDVRVQQVANTAQSALLVTWSTNTEVSSIVTYYPEGNPGDARDEVNVTLVSGEHRMVIRGLVPQTNYALVVSGRDKIGNEATSDVQRITTATDTRPPQVSGLKVEGSNPRTGSVGSEQGQVAQLVITWTTDEPASSQVEYGEGTGTTYSQKTQEDANLKTNHSVVISGLTPSKVYHLRTISKDSAGNIGNSVDTVAITPKLTENALNLVIQNLQEVFSFLGNL